MYNYKLKCVLYTPEFTQLPSTFFEKFPTIDTNAIKYLESYQHEPLQTRIKRRPSQPPQQQQKPVDTTENIPPTPIDASKPHWNHGLDGQIDFRFGPIEIHEMNVIKATNNSKKKKIEEKTVHLGYGVLHLYRDLNPLTEAELPDTKIAKDESLNIYNTEDDTVVCVLAVPSYMTHKDFTNFLGNANSNIEHYRFIKDYSPNKYSVLLKFNNRQSTFAFYQKFNGRRFNMQEPEISHVVYVQKNTIESVVMPPHSYPYMNETLSQDLLHDMAPATMAELPTCPVCLERMDQDITGLLGIQCRHTTQCYCTEKWGDNQCPVCIYSQKPVLTSPSNKKRLLAPPNKTEGCECFECVSRENLWICMICGHVGCGRYQEAHAYDHFMDTNHLYALEVESQRIWDYLGDGYVHRLIQNTVDGALVELPPNTLGSGDSGLHGNTSKRAIYQSLTFDRGSGSGSNSAGSLFNIGSTGDGTNQSQNKLDSLSVDYSYLLTSQLDSQRIYYEDQLDELTTKVSNILFQMKSVNDNITNYSTEKLELLEKKKYLESNIIELEKEREKADKKSLTTKDKHEKLQKSLNEEKLLAKSLVEKSEQLKKEANAKDAEIEALSAKVSDLMAILEAKEAGNTEQ